MDQKYQREFVRGLNGKFGLLLIATWPINQIFDFVLGLCGVWSVVLDIKDLSLDFTDKKRNNN